MLMYYPRKKKLKKYNSDISCKSINSNTTVLSDTVISTKSELHNACFNTEPLYVGYQKAIFSKNYRILSGILIPPGWKTNWMLITSQRKADLARCLSQQPEDRNQCNKAFPTRLSWFPIKPDLKWERLCTTDSLMWATSPPPPLFLHVYVLNV